MEHVRTFGSRGSEQGQLSYPTGIAINEDAVYVSEGGNHRISVFTKKGAFERTFGERGEALGGSLHEPKGLTFVNGWLLVVESKRISIFSPNGEPQQTLSLPGAGHLWGCCAAGSDEGDMYAYVTDLRAGNAKVQCEELVLAACKAAASPQLY